MKQEGIKLIADKGKVLYCTFLESVYGKEISLGNIYYDKNGILLKEPYLLEMKDFREIDESDVELCQRINPLMFNASYADIKTAIIKLKYSNDDQIALMLNYQDDSEKYYEAYNEMQDWRNKASELAKKYCIN